MGAVKFTGVPTLATDADGDGQISYGDSIIIPNSGGSDAHVVVQVNQVGGGYLVTRTAPGDPNGPIVLDGEYWDPDLPGQGSAKLVVPNPARGFKTVDEVPVTVET